MLNKRDKLEFLWLYRAAWLEEAICYATIIALFVASVLIGVTLSGCSIVHYEGRPDGSTYVSGYTIGTDTALSGAKFSVDGTKRSLSLNSAGVNQIDGLRASNELLGTAVGAAVKAAVKP